jgi:hypothetical protein
LKQQQQLRATDQPNFDLDTIDGGGPGYPESGTANIVDIALFGNSGAFPPFVVDASYSCSENPSSTPGLVDLVECEPPPTSTPPPPPFRIIFGAISVRSAKSANSCALRSRATMAPA